MTASVATRVLGWTALVASVVWVWLALVATDPDVVQGDAVRMFYVHVPSIWVAYGCFVFTWLTSAAVLLGVRRLRRALAADQPDVAAKVERGMRRNDRMAGAAAEVGVVLTALTIISGSLWGRVTWGTYWEWDARLTATLMMFVTYLGYLALRRLPSAAGASDDARVRRSAVMAMVSFLTVPLVHYSVDLTRTLHQEASRSGLGQGEYTSEMYATLWYSLLVATLVAVWLVVHRYRLARLEEMADTQHLELALDERRAAAVGAAATKAITETSSGATSTDAIDELPEPR